jgi:LmbE family N-acetylglucosaminyl deacetylase
LTVRRSLAGRALTRAVARTVSLVLVLSGFAVTVDVFEPGVAHNPTFDGDVVVFYPEHPDDEVLWGGSAIRAALDQKGAQDVYVVLVSQGRGADPIPRPAGWDTLTSVERGGLRVTEFRAAMHAIGMRDDHVIVLADTKPGPADNYAEMRSTALRLQRQAEREGTSVTHVAHSYVLDSNVLHRGDGQVIKSLLDEHLITSALFWIKPWYRFEVPAHDLVRYQALTAADADAVRAAIREYTSVDRADGLLAVGYRSTPWYFLLLEGDGRLTSVLHTAAVAG